MPGKSPSVAAFESLCCNCSDFVEDHPRQHVMMCKIGNLDIIHVYLALKAKYFLAVQDEIEFQQERKHAHY